MVTSKSWIYWIEKREGYTYLLQLSHVSKPRHLLLCVSDSLPLLKKVLMQRKKERQRA
jgi:hypothetical protein